MQREGINTLYICGTPQEPFCLCLCECFAFFRFGRLIGEMRKELDFIALDSIKS